VQMSTLVRCMVDSQAPTSAFQEYGLSTTQSCTIAVTCVRASVLPRPAAVMPCPSQRREWNHMYQLGLLYGFSFQLTLPLPFPTL
jgi:hypothetical protein